MGARAYRYLSLYEPDPGCIVEIGSERGEGSTAWLTRYANRHGLGFYTADIDPGAHERAKKITANAYLLPGVTMLAALADPISIAYMDGFDWIPDHAQHEPWIQDQRALYRQLGRDLTNEACQAEHLAEATLISERAAKRCVVICDDTWFDGQWTGKSGLAVPYLEEHGFAVVDCMGCAPDSLGYAVLKR
jgi:hypothetical protein